MAATWSKIKKKHRRARTESVVLILARLQLQFRRSTVTNKRINDSIKKKEDRES